MPVRIFNRLSPAAPVVIADGRFAKLPHVQDSGGRAVAVEAGRPCTLRSVGENDVPFEVFEVNLGGIGFIPLSFLVGVFLRTPRRTPVDASLAVVAPGVPKRGIAFDHDGAAVTVFHAVRLGGTGLHEGKAVGHEDQGSRPALPTLADVFFMGDGDGFDKRLRIVAVRFNEVAVWAEIVMAVCRVRAFNAGLHILIGVGNGGFSVVYIKKDFQITTYLGDICARGREGVSLYNDFLIFYIYIEPIPSLTRISQATRYLKVLIYA